MALFEKPKGVLTADGSVVLAVAEFNKGFSHIAVDDGCWVVMNGGRFSPHLFEEAMEILKQLPDLPADYKPWREAVGMRDD